MEEQQKEKKELLQIEQSNKCESCQKEAEKLLLCGGCKTVKYCSSKCQRSHWNTHKPNCAYYRQKELDKLPLYKGIDWFAMEKNIGHGNFSEIWKAKCKKDQKDYAIKVIQKQRLRQVNKEKDLEMEKHALQKLSGNPYFIEFYGNFSDEQTIYIQLEYVSAGELWHYCRIFGIFNVNILRYYLGHIINAIEYMHSKGIVHRDLKSENIMVTPEKKIKIIDFGTAKDEYNKDITSSGQGGKGKKNYQHFVGTPNYMAPEQIRNRGSSFPTDVYALSSVAFQIWGGFPAWQGGSEYLIFKQSLVEDPVFPQCLFHNQPELKDLILGMCKKEMDERLTVEQIKKHAFFKDFDFDNIPEFNQMTLKTPPTPAEILLLQIREHILNLEGQLKDNEKKLDEEFKKFEEKAQNDPELKDNKMLKQRIQLMKMQAKVMVNTEEYLFSWKEFIEQHEPKDENAIENKKDDSSSSDSDESEEVEQQQKQNKDSEKEQKEEEEAKKEE